MAVKTKGSRKDADTGTGSSPRNGAFIGTENRGYIGTGHKNAGKRKRAYLCSAERGGESQSLSGEEIEEDAKKRSACFRGK